MLLQGRSLQLTKTCAICLAALALTAAIAASGEAQVNTPPWWEAQDANTVSLGFLFPTNAWPPQPGLSIVPSWYSNTIWSLGGPTTPQWHASLNGHTGVWGLTSQLQGQGTMAAQLDNQGHQGWVDHVWYQFDAYVVGGQLCITCAADPSCITNEQQQVTDLPYGWQRVTGTCDITPQPQSEELTWSFSTQAGGKAAIGNVYICSHCEPTPEPVPEPASFAVLAASVVGLVGLTRRK